MFNRIIYSIIKLMPKKLVWVFSKNYIAGKDVKDAIRVSKQMNANGMKVTIDILGEFITRLDEAEANKNEYLDLIDKIETQDIDGNYSIKPTMFGLLLDKEVCYNHVREIVKKAASYGNFIRIDMEDSPCVDMEIELFRRIKAEFPGNVGLVVQAYLRRTLDDVKDLMDIHSDKDGLNFRLCKGIYVEPEEIAYKKYHEINDHFIEDMDFMLKNNIYVGIATHDKPLVTAAYELIEKHKSLKNRYEFQMLYGVTPKLRTSIVNNGHVMRVYVPYGKQWYGYSMRRLKENPKMMTDIIKALFFKG